jgi:hypothetical protein
VLRFFRACKKSSVFDAFVVGVENYVKHTQDNKKRRRTFRRLLVAGTRARRFELTALSNVTIGSFLRAARIARKTTLRQHNAKIFVQQPHNKRSKNKNKKLN